MSRSHSNPEPEKWYKSSWGIALIGAVATVLAAVIGVIGARLGGEDATPTREYTNTTVPYSTDPSTAGTSAETTASTSSQTTNRSLGAAIQWHRKVHMPYEYFLELDSDGPKIVSLNHVNLNGSIRWDIETATFGQGPGFEMEGEARAGSIQGKPSPAACRDALDTSALDDSFDMKIGRTFCVESDDQESHLAAIKVIGWDDDEWDMDIDVTVWATTS